MRSRSGTSGSEEHVGGLICGSKENGLAGGERVLRNTRKCERPWWELQSLECDQHVACIEIQAENLTPVNNISMNGYQQLIRIKGFPGIPGKVLIVPHTLKTCVVKGLQSSINDATNLMVKGLGFTA